VLLTYFTGFPPANHTGLPFVALDAGVAPLLFRKLNQGFKLAKGGTQNVDGSPLAKLSLWDA
jgi:hypothetical protein